MLVGLLLGVTCCLAVVPAAFPHASGCRPACRQAPLLCVASQLFPRRGAFFSLEEALLVLGAVLPVVSSLLSSSNQTLHRGVFPPSKSFQPVFFIGFGGGPRPTHQGRSHTETHKPGMHEKITKLASRQASGETYCTALHTCPLSKTRYKYATKASLQNVVFF